MRHMSVNQKRILIMKMFTALLILGFVAYGQSSQTCQSKENSYDEINSKESKNKADKFGIKKVDIVKKWSVYNQIKDKVISSQTQLNRFRDTTGRVYNRVQPEPFLNTLPKKIDFEKFNLILLTHSEPLASVEISISHEAGKDWVRFSINRKGKAKRKTSFHGFGFAFLVPKKYGKILTYEENNVYFLSHRPSKEQDLTLKCPWWKALKQSLPKNWRTETVQFSYIHGVPVTSGGMVPIVKGKIEVRIELDSMSDGTIKKLIKCGLDITYVLNLSNSVCGELHVDKLKDVAKLSKVKYIEPGTLERLD